MSLHQSSKQPQSGLAPPQTTTLESKMQPRRVTRTLKVHEASECIGSKVRRCIGNRNVRCSPPFVICEHFKMDEMGRPPHPARGAQKITYVSSGRVKIEYSPSNSSELGPGDVTSLMVGKGVIRSVKAMADSSCEDKQEHGSCSAGPSSCTGAPRGKAQASGIQIYMDVPEPFKRNDPSHLNSCHTDIASHEPSPGANVKSLTGRAFGKKADQMSTATPALILDCMSDPGANLELPVKSDWNAFAYVIKGQAHIQGEKAQKHHYVEFMRTPRTAQKQAERQQRQQEDKDHDNRDSDQKEESSQDDDEAASYVTFSVDKAARSGARILFCAAKPSCQPIYRQGPFIDVSMSWIHQAFDDYTERKNGFEPGQWWNNHTQRHGVPNDFMMPPSSSGFEQNSSNKDDSNSKDKTYNPCDSEECSEGNCSECESKHEDSPYAAKGKASYPNAFPPGKVNPASHSTEFNNTDCVEEQQEKKVPKRASDETRQPDKRKRPPDTTDESDATDRSTSPQPKRPNN